MGISYKESEYRVSTTASFGLAILCSVLVFSGLQMYKTHLGSTRLMTLVAGYIASWLFIFMLTALSNLENIMFGKGFQARVIPEVALCLILACSAAGMVHRVSVTVCLLCSIVGLYYLNKMSQSASTAPSVPVTANSKKKKL
ncbi:protein KRTCAP2 homolog isoform X3 [Macrobrachium nipponense]|uniref:protein KRTCAP2 homolog isoform X3 n=1 Tax=Macrobrachium nipponense TaxID=159736 RepID=UPI0030C7A133